MRANITIVKLAALAFASISCSGLEAKEPSANDAVSFLEQVLSTPGIADCRGTDDVGDYINISRNCILSVTNDRSVEVSVKEARGKIVDLHVKGDINKTSNLSPTINSVDAIIFFHLANGAGRNRVDIENLTEARRLRMEVVSGVRSKPYTEINLDGAQIQGSFVDGILRVTVFIQ